MKPELKKEIKPLFMAIFSGQEQSVRAILSKYRGEDLKALLNYQLTKEDVSALKSDLKRKIESSPAASEKLREKVESKSEGFHIDKEVLLEQELQRCIEWGFEEGMSVFLVALSKERVKIAYYLVKEHFLDVGVNLTNAAGVTPIHMFCMLTHGDGRYDEFGILDEALEPDLSEVQEELAYLERVLTSKNSLHPVNVRPHKALNQVTKAIYYGCPRIAETLFQYLDAPLPRPEDMPDITYYYLGGRTDAQTPAESRARLIEVKKIFSQAPLSQRLSHFDAPSPLREIPLTSLQAIHDLLQCFNHYEPAEEVLSLVQAHLQVAEACEMDLNEDSIIQLIESDKTLDLSPSLHMLLTDPMTYQIIQEDDDTDKLGLQ